MESQYTDMMRCDVTLYRKGEMVTPDDHRTMWHTLWFADGKYTFDPDFDEIDGKDYAPSRMVSMAFRDFPDHMWWEQAIKDLGIDHILDGCILDLERIAAFYDGVDSDYNEILLAVVCDTAEEVRGRWTDSPEWYFYPVVKSAHIVVHERLMLAAAAQDEYIAWRREHDELMARLAFLRGELPYESEAS